MKTLSQTDRIINTNIKQSLGQNNYVIPLDGTVRTLPPATSKEYIPFPDFCRHCLIYYFPQLLWNILGTVKVHSLSSFTAFIGQFLLTGVCTSGDGLLQEVY